MYAIRSYYVLLPVLSSCGGGGKLGGTNKSYEIGEYHRAIAQFNNAYKRENVITSYSIHYTKLYDRNCRRKR